MSMLSMQIDSLRSHADLYDGTTKPEMAKELQRPYLAQELREAADTIWQLRDDLQRAHRENAKLRELVERMARALGVGSNLCDRNCGWEFECDLVSCPIEEAMRELGVEVD